MKRILLTLSLALALVLPACQHATLAPGGAYAPTNSVGTATAAPDVTFYQVESSFSLAYGIIQGVFKFEMDNRDFLWGLNPKIKHTLDSIRPDVVEAIRNYDIARQAYKASPTPAGLTTLQTVLAKTQQLASTAQAVTANIQKGN